MSKHPAILMPVKVLVDELDKRVAAGLVSEKLSEDGLSIFCYTRECTYSKGWDDITVLARGLIIDKEKRKVVATPFPKFFNYGERSTSIPDEPFDVYEKLDGSLIIIFQHNGKWRTATKNSFNSDQAQWAQKQIDKLDFWGVSGDTTILAEAIYPENKIVIKYDYESLVLLGAYDSVSEYGYSDLKRLAEKWMLPVAKRLNFFSITGLIDHAKKLPYSEEGFVLKFLNGYRLKIKGDEYKRIHALISNCTPLAIWNYMLEGMDIKNVKKDLPEEFWEDFDTINNLLFLKIVDMITKAEQVNELCSSYTNKQFAEFKVDPLTRKLVFSLRNGKDSLLKIKRGRDNVITPSPRKCIFDEIRPTANVLEGYTPSFGIKKVLEEE